jgi:DNA-binding CsgD family transcriptional regulator
MTTAAKPLPPHGSEARYQGSTTRRACRCRTCVDGWTRAGQRRLLAHLSGQPPKIPTEPVTRHLKQLHAAGMTTQQIATAAQVDCSTVRNHTAGKFPVIRRTTADKLLAVQPGHQPTEGWVPALGAIRRCRALYTLGHGAKAIAAAHPDLSLRSVEYVIWGKRQYITVALNNALRDAYRTLCQMPGSSRQAKLRAANEGWPGPLSWDDIDDPREQPDTEGVVYAIKRHKASIDLELVALRTSQGHTAEQIADEIGCHKRSVVRARRRAEEMEIAA